MRLHQELRLCVVAAALVLAISSASTQARADEIVYDISGTISFASQSGATPVGGPYAVTGGQSFSGTFSYNTSTPATYSGANYNTFYDSTSRISFTIGSLTFGESFLDINGTPLSDQSVTFDEPGFNYYNDFEVQRGSETSSGNYEYVSVIQVDFSNNTSSPLGYLPTSGLPTALSLAELPEASIGVNEYVYDTSTSTYASEFYFDGTITSLTLVSAMVPEPSSMLLVGLAIGMTGVHCWTRHRRSPRA